MYSRNKIIVWISITFLFYLIFSAVRIGAADLLSKYARNEMGTWALSAPDSSELTKVYRVINMARLIAPDMPDSYEDLARLYLARSRTLNGAARSASLKEGIVLIRQAIVLRPISPYSWTILMQFKSELGEYDVEFRRALERAVSLGPWESWVQPIVAEVGLRAWESLVSAEQEMVRKNFVRGLKRQAETMMNIAKEQRRRCHNKPNTAACL